MFDSLLNFYSFFTLITPSFIHDHRIFTKPYSCSVDAVQLVKLSPSLIYFCFEVCYSIFQASYITSTRVQWSYYTWLRVLAL